MCCCVNCIFGIIREYFFKITNSTNLRRVSTYLGHHQSDTIITDHKILTVVVERF